MVWPPPAPQLLPGQVQASVPASFLVPDISFTFWFSLILLKMYNYYISLTISRFYSKIHFFFQVFWPYSSRKTLWTGFSYVHTGFIQTSEADFLAGLETPFSPPPSPVSVSPLEGEGLWNDGRLQLILPQATKVQQERAGTPHMNAMRQLKRHPSL